MRSAAVALALLLTIGCGTTEEAAGPDEGGYLRYEWPQRGSQGTAAERPVSPSDIVVPDGYRIEAVARGLSYATDVTWDADGAMYVSETGGHTYGTGPEDAPPARILRVRPDGSTEVVYDAVVPMAEIRRHASTAEMPEGLIPPILGITFHEPSGLIYVAHRGRYSTLDPATGTFETVIDGIPSWGFFHNNKAVFGPDGKMYFVVSTQGNAGPIDTHWLEVIEAFDKHDAHEAPCEDVEVTGLDLFVPNKLTKDDENDSLRAEVYVPYGVDTEMGQTIEGEPWCHGALYRADADGANPEVVAWGLRSNYGYGFAEDGALYVTQNSGNIMPPRPIYDDWETVYRIEEGAWYGWPDFYSSVPITDARFRRPNDPDFKGKPFDHQFSLTEATRRRLLQGRDRPPSPVAQLPVHSAAQGMAMGRRAFGLDPDEALVAEFGSIIPYYKDPGGWPGFRVQKVDLSTGEVTDWLVNRSRKPASATSGGGLERPIQVVYGPDGALYVVDFGTIEFTEQGMTAYPRTGIVWRVSREG